VDSGGSSVAGESNRGAALRIGPLDGAACRGFREQFGKPVVAFGGAVLHTGLQNHVADFLRFISDRDRHGRFAALLNEDGRNLSFAGIVVERFHVDGAIRRREFDISPAHSHEPAIGFSQNETEASANAVVHLADLE